MKESEDIFRLSALGLDWDIGVRVYEPASDRARRRRQEGRHLPPARRRRRLQVDGEIRAAVRRKVRLQGRDHDLPRPALSRRRSRDWPGDTIKPDGTVRTPIWQRGEHVTPDQYELVRDTGKRMKYGTRTSARAKPGTRFYDRMASWPMAFEEGMKEACRRHFPVGEFSIYVHGHSTGGPYVSMLSQRVPNIAGVIAIENSTFGYHQREEAPVGRPRRQDRGLCGGRAEERRSPGRTRSTISTSAPGATSRATAARRRSARKARRR